MTLVQDYKTRMTGCLRQRKLNNGLAIALYITAFASSATATITTAAASVTNEVAAVLAAVPGVVAVALSMFKPDARAQWWWAKYGKLDDLVMAMEHEGQSEADASKELREFLKVHEPKYPGLGPPPSGATS
jgi:hypothetical protein